jgi:hypothetical protein
VQVVLHKQVQHTEEVMMVQTLSLAQSLQKVVVVAEHIGQVHLLLVTMLVEMVVQVAAVVS